MELSQARLRWSSWEAALCYSACPGPSERLSCSGNAGESQPLTPVTRGFFPPVVRAPALKATFMPSGLASRRPTVVRS